MTGVAAQMCGVNDLTLKFQLESEMGKIDWGYRKCIINDLSPVAAFITSNYCSPTDSEKLETRIKEIISTCESELAWMYKTRHIVNTTEVQLPMGLNTEMFGDINYIVWSDAFICPNCGKEIIFWNAAVDRENAKIHENFKCKDCGVALKKKDCEKAKTVSIDPYLNDTVTQTKQVPVLINYTYSGKRYEKSPDENDLLQIYNIERTKSSYYVPVKELPIGYNTEQPKRSNGIYYVHQLFTNRNLITLSKLFSLVQNNKEMFILTSIIQNATKMYKFRTDGKGGIVSGTLYIPALNQENNIFNLIKGKLNMILKAQYDCRIENCIVSTNSTTDELIPDSSIDYIFTDPPFGANINYSELSFLWEAWLKVITNSEMEAISNSIQGKGLVEYQNLMTKCFHEYFRVLKPNRWITVEFHNSQNAVWNAIQESLQKAGFIIADVRTLDKKQGSFKQVTTTSAVKQDLVISAYKPQDAFVRDFVSHAGHEETAWVFVQQHLENLPKLVMKNEKIELISERQAFLLFDRMVAYHIMNGLAVPLDAIDFYKGLDEKYLKRDGMYFLPDQVNEYDTARITNDVEPIQFELFVTNEKSAIAWLYQQLDTPQTYAELQPKFMQEIKAWDKFEERPELNTLLEENFLQNDDGKWYVPDVTKAADVIKLREKKLLKEFEGYLTSKGKLKLFRAEAVRVGFAKLWTDKNYKLIVETADRLPESVIQEDDKLLMYYDISLGRI